MAAFKRKQKICAFAVTIALPVRVARRFPQRSFRGAMPHPCSPPRKKQLLFCVELFQPGLGPIALCFTLPRVSALADIEDGGERC